MMLIQLIAKSLEHWHERRNPDGSVHLVIVRTRPFVWLGRHCGCDGVSVGETIH